MTSAPVLHMDKTYYERAADDLIALMIHSSEVCQRLEYEFDLRHDYMPTMAHYQAYIGIQTLRKLGRKGSLNDNAVIELAGVSVTHDWYNRRYAEGIRDNQPDFVLMAHLADNARIVRDNGKIKVLSQSLLQEAQRLREGQSFDDTLMRAMNALAMAGTGQAIGDEHASEHIGAIEHLLNNPPPPALMTGINAIDSLTSGLGMKRLSSLISAYKMRKTTMALNILLGSLMTNPDMPAAFYSGEMSQQQVVLNLIAMLAVAWLLKRGEFTLETGMLSGDMLQRVGNAYKRWQPVRANAVDAAIKTYKALGKRLQIYDKQVGGLQSMADAERLFKRNRALYGGQLHIFDYFGLFDMEGSSIYEQSAARAHRFLEMSKDATVLVLAQKNEASVDRETGHSAGAKGGNDLPAASSYVWTTRYKAKETPDKLTLELTHSRFSEVRAIEMDIHPPSGLLLESNWISKL